MNSTRQNCRHRREVRGFTLLELTIATVLSLGMASATLLLLSQQVNFIAMMQKFDFLRDDAPSINMLVSRMVGKATGYRLYATKAEAVSGGGTPVNTGAKAIVLRFRRPNGTTALSMVVFEGSGASGSLNFYNKPASGSWPTSPNWIVSTRVDNVEMSDDTGVVLLRLVGPNQEEVTYVGSGE